MRHVILLITKLSLCLILSAQTPQQTQYAISDVFEQNDVVWFGLDFSNVRLVGSAGFSNPIKLKDYYFDEWNDLLLVQSSKFDIGKYFKKDRVHYDLSIVKKRNDLPKVEDIVTNKSWSLDRGVIEGIISQYNSADTKEGLGLVFIVETFNKIAEEASVYVTFFDVSSRQVLFSKRLTGEPGGFGIRNYWINSIEEVMQAYRKNYKKWK